MVLTIGNMALLPLAGCIAPIDHDTLADQVEDAPLDLIIVEGALYGWMVEGESNLNVHCGFVSPAWQLHDNGTLTLHQRHLLPGPDRMDAVALLLWALEEHTPWSNTCGVHKHAFIETGEKHDVQITSTWIPTTRNTIPIGHDADVPGSFMVDGNVLEAGEEHTVLQSGHFNGTHAHTGEPYQVEYELVAYAAHHGGITPSSIRWAS